jgi:predicted HAD superfamily Cof-like phosphohydrolase
MTDRLWENEAEFRAYDRVQRMSPTQMLREFHETYKSDLGRDWYEAKDLERLRTLLVKEEANEFLAAEKPTEILKELVDILYVCYGYAVSFGWDVEEAFRRVHLSNMSKLDANGEPIFRNDGKVLKGPNYKEPDLSDLITRGSN